MWSVCADIIRPIDSLFPYIDFALFSNLIIQVVSLLCFFENIWVSVGEVLADGVLKGLLDLDLLMILFSLFLEFLAGSL